MPTTKTGEKISWKEFMKRWKAGIEGITPLQQVKSQIGGTWIIIFGLIAGIVVSFFAFKKLWWVAIILIGALFNTIIQYIGLLQRKRLLNSIELNFESPFTEVMKGGGTENVMEII